MPRRDADGRLVRAPRRKMDFKTNFDRNDEVIRYVRFLVNRLANTASECMQDHLGDRRDEIVIKDMHDIIGDASGITSALNALERNLAEKPTPDPRCCPTCGGRWTRSGGTKRVERDYLMHYVYRQNGEIPPNYTCPDEWHVLNYFK